MWLGTLKLTWLVSFKYALVRHTSLMIKMIIKHKKHTVYRVFLRFSGLELLITQLQTPRKIQFYGYASHSRASP